MPVLSFSDDVMRRPVVAPLGPIDDVSLPRKKGAAIRRFRCAIATPSSWPRSHASTAHASLI